MSMLAQMAGLGATSNADQELNGVDTEVRCHYHVDDNMRPIPHVFHGVGEDDGDKEEEWADEELFPRDDSPVEFTKDDDYIKVSTSDLEEEAHGAADGTDSPRPVRPYVFYRDRKEWADVEPVPQDDGPDPGVARIAYSARFAEVHGYLRALLRSGERSQRALELTAHAVRLNPANYTAWQYRRVVLRALLLRDGGNTGGNGGGNGGSNFGSNFAGNGGSNFDGNGGSNFDGNFGGNGGSDSSSNSGGSNSGGSNSGGSDSDATSSPWDLRRELRYAAAAVERDPKNYQVWHHRRTVVEWLDDPSEELGFTAGILGRDAKNYHAWEHRQWAVGRYGLWDGELAFVERLLEEDVRNNSAWNQRHFVVSHEMAATSDGGLSDPATTVADREVRYCLGCIERVPHNESPWNYLKAVLKKKKEVDGGGSLSSRPALLERVLLMKETHRSPHLLAFLVECYQDALEHRRNQWEEEKTLSQALELCEVLAYQEDSIRKEYWMYYRRRLESKYGGNAASAAAATTSAEPDVSDDACAAAAQGRM